MKEIESIEELVEAMKPGTVESTAVQSVDLTEIKQLVFDCKFLNCIFMGCTMDHDTLHYLHLDNHVFPALEVPFNTYPSELYGSKDLYNDYDFERPETYHNTLDKIIYDHYLSHGKEAKSIKETLARRLHDHSITNALKDFLADYEEKKIVAIMGGHSLSRSSNDYRKAAMVSKKLTEMGYLMISGGGPGAMEATHVGAWFAGKSIEALDEGINILSTADTYDHEQWLPTAFKVMNEFPLQEDAYKSLGIPTWLYGHEPPTPFATHIAKYFANSVREEGLLAIAKGGVIFTPGSAGTIQEIFQDLTQNHYKSYGYASPMVFMNKQYWSYDRPIYPLLELMKLRGNLNNLLIGLYDQIEDIVDHIESFD